MQISHTALRVLVAAGLLTLGLVAMFHDVFDLEETIEAQLEPIETMTHQQIDKAPHHATNLF